MYCSWRRRMSFIAGNHVLARPGFNRRLPRAASRRRTMLCRQQDPQLLIGSYTYDSCLRPRFRALRFKPSSPCGDFSVSSIVEWMVLSWMTDRLRIRGLYVRDFIWCTLSSVYPLFWTSQILPYFQDGTQLTNDFVFSVDSIKLA